VPSDIYAYLEKMDRDDDEAEEVMMVSYGCHVMSRDCPLQVQTMSFEIKQDELETLQKKSAPSVMSLHDN